MAALITIIIGLYTHLQMEHTRAVIPDVIGVILLTISYAMKRMHECCN